MDHQVEQRAYAGAFTSFASQIRLPASSSGHTVGRMTAALADMDPVILLVSRWLRNARFMVDRFIETLPDDVTVARVTAPCHGAASTLRSLLTAFGAEQTHLNVKLLEEELKHILVKQMNYCRRTLICFEVGHETEPWVLDRVQRLIELEEREKVGLTVVVSGGPNLRELLTQPPYDKVISKAGPVIVTEQLTPEESRDYITRRIRAAGVSNIYQVFEYAAMTAVHEFSGGMTDKIDALCRQCIELSEKEAKRPVTPAMVRRAHAQLNTRNAGPAKNGKAKPAVRNGSSNGASRLVAKMNGSVSSSVKLTEGRILIGRAALCDISVPSPTVSRHHAMVVKTDKGVGLVDLGSTNGTFVDGKRVSQHLLENGDAIRVGDCTITFFGETS